MADDLSLFGLQPDPEGFDVPGVPAPAFPMPFEEYADDAVSVAMGGPADEILPFAEGVDQIFGEFEQREWDSDDALEHDANLAQFLERGRRDRLAQRVIEWVDADRQSRADWEYREAKGIESLGLSKRDVETVKRQVPGTDWRSTAVHPGLMKACIQFWARAWTELWTPGGPAKAVVMGATTAEREAQAERVAGFLNYLYTQEMPNAQAELSQALFRLPLSGSIFRKAYFDPLIGTIQVRFLESQDFVKPYSASDLDTAPRYTHIVKITRNDLNRCAALGYYLADYLSHVADEQAEHQLLDTTIDRATGQSPTQGRDENQAEEANRDILYETSVTLDLEDYAWDDPLGEALNDPRTGARISIGVPYLVTVHKESQAVLAIRRDWRAGDARKRRRKHVVEYKFLPGFGGYGFGLLHVAGGLSDSQTGFLRYLQDGCTLDTVGRLSGWVDQQAVGMRGLPPLKLGEFQTVAGMGADFSKAIMRPDFQWRTNNTRETLEYLDALLDELVAATDAMVGEEAKNIPVGTMLARVEQKGKQFAAIFALLHGSLGRELRAVAELAADYLPERYPYAVEGADRAVFAADFDERVDVIPVSDPNVVSATQRMAQAQVILEQAAALFGANPSPETWATYLEAYRHLLEIMRIADLERFVPQLPQPAPSGADPAVAEEERKNAALIAEEERKDIKAQNDMRRQDEAEQARVQREAQRMQFDQARQAAGDQAQIAASEATDIDAMARKIGELAMARNQQQAQALGGVPAPM